MDGVDSLTSTPRDSLLLTPVTQGADCSSTAAEAVLGSRIAMLIAGLALDEPIDLSERSCCPRSAHCRLIIFPNLALFSAASSLLISSQTPLISDVLAMKPE